jgi:hypothetical protein
VTGVHLDDRHGQAYTYVGGGHLGDRRVLVAYSLHMFVGEVKDGAFANKVAIVH